MSTLQPTWAESLSQLFFPQRNCPYCASVNGNGLLCAACCRQSAILPRCPLCAQFGEYVDICPTCVEYLPAFSQARAAFPYEGVLREHLQAFKYQEQTWRRRPLTQLLYATWQNYYADINFDAVVPVPLCASRLQERGYNQCQLLSYLLALKLSLPHQPELLQRIKETPPLYPYDGAERRRLLAEVFVASPVKGSTILLVDDIFTSGATLDACSKALKEQEAKDVYVLTVAATIMA
jgi:ComF family protein